MPISRKNTLRPSPDTILLIFDCDGVLVDSELLACAALAELMTSLGHPMTPHEAVQTFVGRTLKDVLILAEDLLRRPIPSAVGMIHAQRLLARFRRELRPVAGIEAAISALPYKRCVASSSAPDRVALSLEVTGLAPLFGRHVYSANQVANGKPAPDLFLFAAQAMGIAPPHCIVIEDSVIGVEAARTANMPAIGFAGASHATDDLAERLVAAGADIVIRSMMDLPPCVEFLSAKIATVL